MQAPNCLGCGRRLRDMLDWINFGIANHYIKGMELKYDQHDCVLKLIG